MLTSRRQVAGPSSLRIANPAMPGRGEAHDPSWCLRRWHQHSAWSKTRGTALCWVSSIGNDDVGWRCVWQLRHRCGTAAQGLGWSPATGKIPPPCGDLQSKARSSSKLQSNHQKKKRRGGSESDGGHFDIRGDLREALIKNHAGNHNHRLVVGYFLGAQADQPNNARRGHRGNIRRTRTLDCHP